MGNILLNTLHAEREISLRYLDNEDGVADSTEMQDKEEISYNKPGLLLWILSPGCWTMITLMYNQMKSLMFHLNKWQFHMVQCKSDINDDDNNSN